MSKLNEQIKGKIQSGIVYPEFFQINQDESVLNVGCGNGVQALIYQGKFREMTGVDINPERLAFAERLAAENGIVNFNLLNANVEAIPLTRQFDKIIAVDIIEHVQNPEKLIFEMRRLLSDHGRLMITFPAMHDKYEHGFHFFGRVLLRRKKQDKDSSSWDPDKHQYDYSLRQWLDLMGKGGFHLEESRASTMFPPLHYVGIPRFWFFIPLIHEIDSFFCKLPFIKNYGQTLIAIFRKE